MLTTTPKEEAEAEFKPYQGVTQSYITLGTSMMGNAITITLPCFEDDITYQ